MPIVLDWLDRAPLPSPEDAPFSVHALTKVLVTRTRPTYVASPVVSVGLASRNYGVWPRSSPAGDDRTIVAVDAHWLAEEAEALGLQVPTPLAFRPDRVA